MKLHPYCSLFPKAEDDQFNELVESIRKNGLRDSMITFEGMLLDGQNREAACDVAHAKKKYEKFKGTAAQALEFVIDKNMTRRHLTTSQRAMLAEEIASRRNSDVSLAAAAEKMHVSRDTAFTARKIKKASPALAKKVKAGKISLNAAKKKIEKPKKAEGEMTALEAREIIRRAHEEKNNADIQKSIGQICCEAYYAKLKNKSVKWDDLPDEEKWAWQAGANALKGRV